MNEYPAIEMSNPSLKRTQQSNCEDEYEDVHRYSPVYEEIRESRLQNQVPNDQQTECDFDLCQCPAYGPLPLYSKLDNVVEAEIESEQL